MLNNTGLMLKYQTFKVSATQKFIKDKAGENINTILNIQVFFLNPKKLFFSDKNLDISLYFKQVPDRLMMCSEEKIFKK